MDNRMIENKLAAIRTAKSYLDDAEKQLEAILFDRVPAGRVNSSMILANDNIISACQNLAKTKWI